MKNYLLMTATVTPSVDQPFLTRTDPRLRLDDYIEAFKYYLSDNISHIDGIIFVDNSNNPLREINLLVQNYKGAKQIEVLSFYGLDYPNEFTRGYGELKLIEYAFEHSKLIQSMTDADRFWKVTGRLKVLTIDKLIKRAPRNFELCADFRYRRNQVDTRLIAFSIVGYKKYIYGRLDELSSLVIEYWLFNKLTPLLATKEGECIVTEFRVVAKFDGFAGYKSSDYMSPRQRLIYFVRTIYLTTKYLFK